MVMDSSNSTWNFGSDSSEAETKLRWVQQCRHMFGNGFRSKFEHPGVSNRTRHGEYKIAAYPLAIFLEYLEYICTDFIWKGIFRIVIWALTRQLTNMLSLFIVWHLV
jgi:hypothetical protein